MCHQSPITCIRHCQDIVAVGVQNDNIISLWKILANGTSLHFLTKLEPSDTILSLDINEQYLVAGGFFGDLSLWKRSPNQDIPVKVYVEQFEVLHITCIALQGNRIIAAVENGELQISEITPTTDAVILKKKFQLGSKGLSIAISDAGGVFISTERKGMIYLFLSQDLNFVQPKKIMHGQISQIFCTDSEIFCKEWFRPFKLKNFSLEAICLGLEKQKVLDFDQGEDILMGQNVYTFCVSHDSLFIVEASDKTFVKIVYR